MLKVCIRDHSQCLVDVVTQSRTVRSQGDKARVTNRIKLPSTLAQKHLKSIELAPRERGSAAAPMIDWLLLSTQMAFMKKGIPNTIRCNKALRSFHPDSFCNSAFWR
jgi:hypothetical protein